MAYLISILIQKQKETLHFFFKLHEDTEDLQKYPPIYREREGSVKDDYGSKNEYDGKCESEDRLIICRILFEFDQMCEYWTRIF